MAGWVHRVNKQKKQVELCDDQEFMPREYEIKNGKVVNQAFPTNCDYAYADVCCILVHFALFRMQFSFQPKKASGCRLLSSGVTRRLHTRSGCIPAVSSSGCTFPTFPFLFSRLSTFGLFTRRSGQRSRSSRRQSHMPPLPRPRPKPIAGRSHRPRVIHPQEVCLAPWTVTQMQRMWRPNQGRPRTLQWYTPMEARTTVTRRGSHRQRKRRRM